MNIDTETKTACATLAVSPNNIWDKAGKSIMAAGRFAPQEALRVIKMRTLSDNELAVLVTMGIQLIESRMSQAKSDPRFFTRKLNLSPSSESAK